VSEWSIFNETAGFRPEMFSGKNVRKGLKAYTGLALRNF